MSIHKHIRNEKNAPWWLSTLVSLFGRNRVGEGGYIYKEFRGKGYFSHRVED